MRTLTRHLAKADAKLALDLANTSSPFTIEVRFVGGLTATQQQAFATAADRWASVIVGDLPSALVDGEVIDDVLILAQGAAIDGPGTILGQAGPTWLRPTSAGASAYLPAKGKMVFDQADLAAMEKDGTLLDVITHEMGHVLGVGTIWPYKGLLKGAGTKDPTFTGASTQAEYGELLKAGGPPKPVPVENTGGPGTRDSHWRETVFATELMSGFIAASGNALSRVTVASLADLGYQVNLDAADPYTLTPKTSLKIAGLTMMTSQPHDDSGIVLGNIPMILPDDAVHV